MPSSSPKTEVSATFWPSTTAMTAAMITEATSASPAIVVYWRRMNATAPSKMVDATSCIASVP
jgi:hypothetical protein